MVQTKTAGRVRDKTLPVSTQININPRVNIERNEIFAFACIPLFFCKMNHNYVNAYSDSSPQGDYASFLIHSSGFHGEYRDISEH